MTEISLILFDLNGVLYHYERDARIGYLAAQSKQSPEAVRAAIWDSGFEDSGDSGALDADAYLQGFGACLGGVLPEAEWVAALRAAITPIAATLALLPRLRPAVQCAVLTNNNWLVRRHFSTLYPEVGRQIGDKATLVSAELGARKPDPEVYRRGLKQLGFPASATLFIDDSATNLAGSEAAGLQGYKYTGSADLEQELRRLGLLV